ncbi:hypothetical protein SAMN04487943_10263 [Gracilibacillus orientalis]|uniref:Uncharacterized protein n=2 Tax=Gracilibacillus orientalis TaxID=334253 RepID=A0A1I4IE52_9BACI|nr:hypothetical protein SAMN04487943_10263 [Gracilibacillus orientalis]
MAVYITIAIGITLLIGIGWFVKSYFDGKTVFNNNSIQQYAYDLHQPKALSSLNIYLPKGLEVLSQEDDEDDEDESEEDEVMEDEEESPEIAVQESEEDLYQGTEQVELGNNNSYYYQDNNEASSSDYSSNNSSNNSDNGTVRDDVYGG